MTSLIATVVVHTDAYGELATRGPGPDGRVQAQPQLATAKGERGAYRKSLNPSFGKERTRAATDYPYQRFLFFDADPSGPLRRPPAYVSPASILALFVRISRAACA